LKLGDGKKLISVQNIPPCNHEKGKGKKYKLRKTGKEEKGWENNVWKIY